MKRFIFPIFILAASCALAINPPVTRVGGSGADKFDVTTDLNAPPGTTVSGSAGSTFILPATTSIGPVSSTEVGYVNGVEAPIQGQINTKSPILSVAQARTAIRSTYATHPYPPTITASVQASATAPTLLVGSTSFPMDADSTYYRVYGCGDMQSEAAYFGATAWRSSTALSDTPTLWTPWDIEFVSSASQVELTWAAIAAGDEFRLIVDDYVVVNLTQDAGESRDRGYFPTSAFYGAAGAGNFRLLLDWGGSEVPRHYRMESWSNSRFITTRVPAGDTVVKPADDDRKTILFQGDSWLEVGGGNFVWNNWAAQLGRELRADYILSGAGGCGYKATAGGGRLNGLDRLSSDTAGLAEPDYVIIAYGLNDLTFEWGDAGEIAATKANIDAFFPALRLIFPNAKFIVFGAFIPRDETTDDEDFNAYLSTAVATAGGKYIETIDAGCFLGDLVAIEPYLADVAHLTNYGHSELAAWALTKVLPLISN